MPAETFVIELVHQGLSRQRQFGADTVHHQRGLPRSAPILLSRLPGEPGAPTAVWEGSAVVAGGGAATFPAYGRGVAAGYRVRLTDGSLARPDLLTRVEVMIQYEARQDENIVNLRDVSLGTGLRPGVVAVGLATLTGPAPVGGVKVRLRSTDPSALAVPAEITVPAGNVAASFPAEALKPTGPVPPRLTASTLDGVNRHALVPVAAAPPALTKSVIVGGEGTTFAVALGRPPASPAGPRPEPRIYLTHTPAGSPDEPAGPAPGTRCTCSGRT